VRTVASTGTAVLLPIQVVFQGDGLGNKKGDLLKRWHEIVHSYIQPFLTFDSDRFSSAVQSREKNVETAQI
jgi:hypothetical protein